MASRLLRLGRLDGAAGLLPRAEAALDVGDGLEAHAVRGLRGQSGPQAAGAEEDELLVLREDRLVVRALRVDPELQHAARAMEGAGHLAVALQFADVADVDEHGVVAAGELDRVLGRQRLDLPLGRLAQRLDAGGDGLRHGASFKVPAKLADAAAPLKPRRS